MQNSKMTINIAGVVSFGMLLKMFFSYNLLIVNRDQSTYISCPNILDHPVKNCGSRNIHKMINVTNVVHTAIS